MYMYHMPRADKHHPPSLRLEPTEETEERKTMFDLEKNSTSRIEGQLSMTWEEVKRAAKDQEGWKLVVRALCSRGNDKE